jgi:hypothetical protein
LQRSCLVSSAALHVLSKLANRWFGTSGRVLGIGVNWYTDGVACSAGVLSFGPVVCGCVCGFFGLSFLGGVDCQCLMVMTCLKANIILAHRSCWATVPSKSSKEKDREEMDPAEYCIGLCTHEGHCVMVRAA